jgi:hypothetical protein
LHQAELTMSYSEDLGDSFEQGVNGFTFLKVELPFRWTFRERGCAEDSNADREQRSISVSGLLHLSLIVFCFLSIVWRLKPEGGSKFVGRLARQCRKKQNDIPRLKDFFCSELSLQWCRVRSRVISSPAFGQRQWIP